LAEVAVAKTTPYLASSTKMVNHISVSFPVQKLGIYTILSKTLLAGSSPDSLFSICALK